MTSPASNKTIKSGDVFFIALSNVGVNQNACNYIFIQHSLMQADATAENFSSRKTKKTSGHRKNADATDWRGLKCELAYLCLISENPLDQCSCGGLMRLL